MIRVQVLGHLSLEARDAPVHALAAQPLRGSVFLYLCVEREASRETLVRMFWPDREEDKARRLLSQTLYELKRLFGEDWFAGAGEVIRLEGVSVDVHLFEAARAKGELERALAFYQGTFLSDFQRFDSAEFNAWVDRKKAHYERLHRRARRERIKKLLEEGDRNAALSVAQRWSELDPLEDEAQQRAIELLHELGRRTEALQTYDTYVARLKEVDLVPLDEMRALAKRLREGASTALPVATVAVKTPERIDTKARASSAVSDATPTTRPHDGRRNPRVKALAAALVLTLIVAVRFTLTAMRDDVRTASVAIEAGYDLSRVAVLYFDDHTEGGKLDYLAKGLTEALIQELSRVDALNVVSRNGVKQFQNANVSTDSIRRTLKVGTIVEGSVQQAGDSIRVNVHLIDASTGDRLDSKTLTTTAEHGFQLEDEAVRQVTAFLRDRLGRKIDLQRVARGASNEEAYRLYQTADDFREQVLSANPQLRSKDPQKYEFLLRSADSMLMAARRRDPKWLQPVLLMGWLAFDRGAVTNAPGATRSNVHLRSAIRLANEVLTKQPTIAEAFELRGTALAVLAANDVRGAAGDSLHREAERDLERAVQLEPTRASAWQYLSRLRQLKGALDEAEMYAVRAFEADVFWRESPDIANRLYRIANDQERFDEAQKWCATGRSNYPTDYRFVECYLLIAATRSDGGKISLDSARVLVRGLRLLDRPDATVSDYQPVFWDLLIARLWAKHGQPDSARAVVARARQAVSRDSKLDASFPFDAAHALLLAGDTAGAVRELDKYIEINPRYRTYVTQWFGTRSVAHLLKKPE